MDDGMENNSGTNTFEKAQQELEQRVQERTPEVQESHEQSLHSEKLTASIAHEFNNPLQSVMTIIKGLGKYAALEEKEKKLLGLALLECHRMKNLIATLSDFHRPISGKTEPVDLHAILDALLLIGKKEFHTRKITVEKKAMPSFEKQDLVAKLRVRNKRLKGEITARRAAEMKLQESQAGLERQVEQRTVELTRTIGDLKTALETLSLREKEVQAKNRELHDINATMNVMLKRRDKEHREIRQEIAVKTMETVLPLLKKAQSQATGSTKKYMETAQANLQDVFLQYPHDRVLTNAKLAPRELQIVHYIRQNKSSKEMADLLGLSLRTVESYRDNIRKKLGVKNQKKNLRKFLTSLI